MCVLVLELGCSMFIWSKKNLYFMQCFKRQMTGKSFEYSSRLSGNLRSTRTNFFQFVNLFVLIKRISIAASDLRITSFVKFNFKPLIVNELLFTISVVRENFSLDRIKIILLPNNHFFDFCHLPFPILWWNRSPLRCSNRMFVYASIDSMN